MTLPRTPLWALAAIGSAANPLAVLILETGTSDAYTAIRTRLTLAGCINRISLSQWQQADWPNSGRMQLHYAGTQVTRLSTPGPTLQIPGGLEAGPEWIAAAANRSRALFAVVPPNAMNSAPPAGLGEHRPADARNFEAFPAMIASLAHSGRLTAGLATATNDPHLN